MSKDRSDVGYALEEMERFSERYDQRLRDLEERLDALEEQPTVKIKRIFAGHSQNEDGTYRYALPQYRTAGAAGLDLVCTESWSIYPGECATLHCGFALELPRGYEAQIRPRSGLARDYGITVLNSPGTVDEDYRGEVMVLVMNHGQQSHRFRAGDRVAQMVIAKVARAQFQEVKELSETERGAGGFGHTGV